MYCIKCGTELPADALFCKKCGNRVSAEPAKKVNNTVSSVQQETEPISTQSDPLPKQEKSSATQAVKAMNAEEPKKQSKRIVYIVLSAVFTLVALILIFSFSGSNRLVGTWEKTSGEFQLWGYWEDHDSLEGKTGELVFKSKDFYIVTDGDGYVYSDSYKIVDDGHLIMLCDGEKNTYQYSISGNTLIIECQYGEISYWTRR